MLLYAQNSTASFDILKTPTCLKEDLKLQNNSTNATTYLWDLCIGDLNEVPVASVLVSDAIKKPYKIEVVEYNDSYIGFTSDRTNKTLHRINFEDSTLTNFTSVDLGLSFSDPLSVEIFNLNGEWNGLILSFNNEIIRLNFGASLLNTPSVQSLGNLGSLNGPIDLEVVQNDTHVYAFIANFSAAYITRVRWDKSFGSQDVVSINISGISQMSAISLINDEQDWVAHLASRGNDKIFKVVIGADLSNTTPVVSEVTYISTPVNDPTGISTAEEGGNFYHFIETQSGDLYRINDGSTLLDASTVATDNLGKFGFSGSNWRFSLFQLMSRWYGFATNNSTNSIYKFSFDETCEASKSFSTVFEPENISYSNSGSYKIELKAFDSNGNASRLTKTVTVSTNTAPDINFTTENICLSNPINFTSSNTSGDVTSYNWDFGDTNTSTDPNPSHTYASAGDYTVTLTVTSSAGCENFVQQDITVYEEPAPSFDMPVVNICTNQTYFFENTTLGTFDGNITYEWFINGESVATTEDLNYEFPTGGAKEVKLVATIPGCSIEAIQNIANVDEGANPSFTVNDDCLGEPFQFNNTSTGDIASQEWDFGNGFTSSLANPSFQYADPGTYNVTLTLTNVAGCITDTTNFVTVFELPTVSFSNDLACEGSPTQFTDSSTIGDANISTWSWSFDDPSSDSNASAAQNPAHTFTGSGNFDVKLVVQSTNGCTDSLTQVVNVLPAPEVNFSYDRLCINEAVQFQDLSQPVAGENITSWAWDLGGVFSTEQNPEATFEFAKDYGIGLTVTSENLCTATIYKTITVAPVPEVTFAVENACDNAEAHLYDTTDPLGDNVATRSWNFADLASAGDSSTYFHFPQAGSYEVGLSIVTQNGCEYATSQSVEVTEAPTASFTSPIMFGAPPLEIAFVNNSANAIAYRWDFDDGVTSDEAQPVHTFTEEGTHNVQLVATDALGCSDTTSRAINVVFPDLELELSRLFMTEKDGSNTLIMMLINNGTIVIDSVKVIIDLGNQLSANELIKTTIMPGDQVNVPLQFSFVNKDLEFICLTAEALIEGVAESDATNNSRCISFEDDVVILNPYPNPGTGEIHLNVVSNVSETLTARLFSTKGSLVKDVIINELGSGYNDIILNVTDVEAGFYFLEVEYGGKSEIFRIVIDN